MNQELETRSALSANSLMSVMPGHSSSFVAWAHMVAAKIGATEEQVIAIFASQNSFKVGDTTIQFDPATQRIHFTRPAPAMESSTPTQPRVRPPAGLAKKEMSQAEIAKLVHQKIDAAEARGEFLSTAAAVSKVYEENKIPMQ